MENITVDIHVNALHGAIILHLPENGRYEIDAKSDFGNVTSDFPGREKRRPWLIGHQIAQHDRGAGQRLHLRIGYGDIVILQIRKPPYPRTGVSMNGAKIRARIAEIGIIPAVRLSCSRRFVRGEAVSPSGIPLVEVTMTVPGAVQVIEEVARNDPEFIVGAGTVFGIDIAERCLDAGAKFLTTNFIMSAAVGFISRFGVSVLGGCDFGPTNSADARRRLLAAGRRVSRIRIAIASGVDGCAGGSHRPASSFNRDRHWFGNAKAFGPCRGWRYGYFSGPYTVGVAGDVFDCSPLCRAENRFNRIRVDGRRTHARRMKIVAALFKWIPQPQAAS